MKTFRMGILVMAALLATVFTFEGMGQAADYPKKPVQIIVGFPPGGPTDLTARALAKAAEPFFPQPFTVVNKPGGGSVLATNEVVRAAPDGYTLGALDISALSVSPQLVKNLSYKGPDDIIPIIHYLTQQIVFVVRTDSPFKTMKEIIEYAKANPGKLRIGHAGIGTTTHIHLASLKVLGFPVTDVPFAGAAPTVTALLGGHIDGLMLNVLPTLPHVKSGKFRYIGLFADERYREIPELIDVSTLKELGYNVLTEGSDYFISAPKGTPQEITDMLYNALLKAEKTDFYQKFCKDNIVFLTYKGAADIRKQLNESYKFYTDFLPKIGLAPAEK
jgi:tripartite-type tricarboxylate transporter receptor subunit TctC